MKPVSSAWKGAVVGGLLSLLAACHSDSITGQSAALNQSDFSRPLELSVGALFDVDVFEGASGKYDVPPAISSASVVYLSSEIPLQPIVPAGQRRRFHFRAAQAGTAVISFRTEFPGGAFTDSIVVK